MKDSETYWSINMVQTKKMVSLDKKSVCGRDPKLQEAYDHLHFQWLGADTYILSFVGLFGQSIHYKKTSVALTPIQAGLLEYSKTLHPSISHEYFPHQRLKCFLQGCIESALTVCRFVVADHKKDERWSLVNEHSFSFWSEEREGLTIHPLHMQPDEFAQLLYEKVVPLNMKYAMRRFKHEQSIMARALDYCH